MIIPKSKTIKHRAHILLPYFFEHSINVDQKNIQVIIIITSISSKSIIMELLI